MRTITPAILVFAILLPLFVVGCPRKNNKEDLYSTVLLHHADLRWARYNRAASSMDTTERNIFLARVDELEEDLYITEFEITDFQFDGVKEEATVEVYF